jgi:hypothetical protein
MVTFLLVITGIFYSSKQANRLRGLRGVNLTEWFTDLTQVVYMQYQYNAKVAFHL